MIYTVVWKTSAEEELAQLWIQAPDRAAVTQAANRIDALSRHEREAAGGRDSGGKRYSASAISAID